MFKYKVVLLGNSGVGKSNICIRLMNNNFNISENSTIGAQFFCYKIMIKDKEFPLQIWDTAGHERFKSLLPLYLRHSMFIILVIDVSINIESQLESWMSYINNNQHFFDKNHVIIIVFNKIDLLSVNDINISLVNYVEKSNIPSINDIHKKYNIDSNNILKISCKTNFGFIELKNCLAYNTEKIYDILINNTNNTDSSFINNTQNIVLNNLESTNSESTKSTKSLLDYIPKINIIKDNCYKF
jgi:small GTP-binding protein